jgi:hypothetical protein
VHQVAKEVLEAMAPEEDPVMPGNLHCSLHCKPGYVVETPIEIKKEVSGQRETQNGSEHSVDTYVLPRGSCSGLMLAFLKWANQVSIGQAAKECGPLKMMGSWCLA